MQTNQEHQSNTDGLVGPVNITKVTISGRKCKALLDTGSQVTTITDEFVSAHPTLKLQNLKKSPIIISGAGGQSVPHQGYILLTMDALGEVTKNVPALVVPVTEFRRSIPLLIGTNVILTLRDSIHKKYGRGLMSKMKKESFAWHSAFQCVNSDGADIARTNGEIGHLRYTGRCRLKYSLGQK